MDVGLFKFGVCSILARNFWVGPYAFHNTDSVIASIQMFDSNVIEQGAKRNDSPPQYLIVKVFKHFRPSLV
jgi:hypothetical protein